MGKQRTKGHGRVEQVEKEEPDRDIEELSNKFNVSDKVRIELGYLGPNSARGDGRYSVDTQNGTHVGKVRTKRKGLWIDRGAERGCLIYCLDDNFTNDPIWNIARVYKQAKTIQRIKSLNEKSNTNSSNLASKNASMKQEEMENGFDFDDI